MRLPVCLVALVVCVSTVGGAQAPTPAPVKEATDARSPAAVARPAAGQTRLAVRRVVLYKNGVGFFEHVGRVVGDEDVTVTFTSAQLDDALKSLTALDLGRGRIAGITYNSTAPLSQRLAGLPFKLGDKADHMEFYRSVRGARVEVRTAAGIIRGRLVSAEPVQPGYGSPQEATTMLTLVGDRGEVRGVRLDRQTSVRIADDEVSSGITRYLTLVADDLRRDERRVTVAARGTGARDLYLSYVAEVPVWKSTYRLLMPSEGRPAPLLQGWAVVDNTVGEDWDGVEMALVAGAPQSFVQRLSQPRYVPRTEVPVLLEANLTPVLHDLGVSGQFGTIRGVARDNHGTIMPGVSVTLEAAGTAVFRAVTNGEGEFRMSARPGAYTLVFELPGFGTARQAVSVQAGEVAESNAALGISQLTESITVTGVAPVVDTASTAFVVSAPDSRTLEEQMALELPQATGQPVGELFEYRIAGAVTIRKNESALVPILRSEIAADRVSVWNDGLGTSRPLRAVWLTNTTGLTLDGGTMSVVDGGAFGGEGTMEALVPGARRLVSFARDLSMSVAATSDADRRTLIGLATADGALVERRETCGRRTYTIRNDDRAARTVVIEHPIRHGWTLVGGSAPAESTPAAHRFQVVVPARATDTFVVQEGYPSEFRYEAAQLTEAQVAAYATRDGLDVAAAAALRHLVQLRLAMSRAESAAAGSEAQAAAIAVEQERVRENMGALKGTREERQLLQRYVRQLSEHENRLTTLAQDAAAAAAQAVAARTAFELAVQAFSVQLATPGATCR